MLRTNLYLWLNWIEHRSSEPGVGGSSPSRYTKLAVNLVRTGTESDKKCFNKPMKKSIPKEVLDVVSGLKTKGFEAYLVGGCVRDLILGRAPNDWDITTNAHPEEIQECFEETFYENNFGTVGVKTRSQNPETQVVEVTPYRTESTYSDNRRPDSVSFAKTLSEDLSRRDFTINALAYDPDKDEIIDEFGGKEDLTNKSISTVGNADERFQEDALRILRAIRFAAQLDFGVSQETLCAISTNKNLLDSVSRERIGEEFAKIIKTSSPSVALGIAEKLNILGIFSNVLREAVGIDQNKQAHLYDVWEHLVRSCQHAADKDFKYEVRLAALFHDIGKPPTKRTDKNGKTSFFGHEVVGARITEKVLKDLKFSRETIKRVVSLVRWHMFFSDTEEITLSAVRRLIANVGKEAIWDLIDLRKCDRIGSGRPKEEPYRLRQFIAMIDEVLHDPVSVGMLKMNGDIMLQEFHMKPGPRIGWMLHALLEEVLEDPQRNTLEHLSERVRGMEGLPDVELRKKGESGIEKRDEIEAGHIKEIKKRRKVA